MHRTCATQWGQPAACLRLAQEMDDRVRRPRREVSDVALSRACIAFSGAHCTSNRVRVEWCEVATMMRAHHLVSAANCRLKARRCAHCSHFDHRYTWYSHSLGAPHWSRVVLCGTPAGTRRQRIGWCGQSLVPSNWKRGWNAPMLSDSSSADSARLRTADSYKTAVAVGRPALFNRSTVPPYSRDRRRRTVVHSMAV